jgi:hypothetical protein
MASGSREQTETYRTAHAQPKMLFPHIPLHVRWFIDWLEKTRGGKGRHFREDPVYGNISSFSQGLSPRAARIFLLVSCLHITPFSTRAMVNWEIPAFLASSDLLINRLSRTSFNRFVIKWSPPQKISYKLI